MFLSAWVYLIFQRVKVNKRKELYRKITSNLYRLLYLTASITALKNSVIRNFQISARGPISFTFPAIPLISILITLFYGLTLEQFLIQILKSFQKLWFINHYLSQYFFLFFVQVGLQRKRSPSISSTQENRTLFRQQYSSECNMYWTCTLSVHN